MCIRSVRIDRTKIVRFMRWGIMSGGGTGIGKPRNVESKMDMIGMAKSRLDGCGFNSFQSSFVVKSRVSDVRKRVHSV